MATNVNYDDKRFTQVENDKQEALTEMEQTYGDMIDQSDSFYQAQIDASKDWAEKQSQIQQEQTDFAIEQIEQQKDQAQKDYTKEQSGAYVDWQKQSDKYGAKSESIAAQGMQATGFSESSQVSMYNTYQNRVATARESYNMAVLNFNNAIKDARLQNSAILAEIAKEALQQQLELSLEGFQYKNQLILEQANKKVELENVYYQRYQDVLAQINHENAMAEEIRQFNLEYNEKIRQFNEEIARLKANDEKEYQLEIKNLELQKQKLAEEKRQFDAQMEYQKSKDTTKSSSIPKTPSKSPSKNTSPKFTAVAKDDESKSESGGTKPTNNTASIMALGYGPISASRLAELLSTGQVTRTLKNGQYYYSRNTGSTSYNRLKNMGLSR